MVVAKQILTCATALRQTVLEYVVYQVRFTVGHTHFETGMTRRHHRSRSSVTGTTVKFYPTTILSRNIELTIVV